MPDIDRRLLEREKVIWFGRHKGTNPLPDINRCAFVLEAGQGYLEWARHGPDGDPEVTLEALRQEGTVYLIPYEYADTPETWLKKNYKMLFEQELWGWSRDKSRWPADLSYKAFQNFFRVRYCSIVMDAGAGTIRREAD